MIIAHVLEAAAGTSLAMVGFWVGRRLVVAAVVALTMRRIGGGTKDEDR